MKKQIAAMALALCTIASCASAEQAAANQYRTWFKSGTFFVDFESEYKDCFITKAIAAQNDMRMERNGYRLKGYAAMFGGGKKDYPDTLYRQGKYYKFSTKKKATMAAWNQINDPNIDPTGGWNTVQYSLAVPDEFAPVCAYDAYRPQSAAMGKVSFTGSMKRTIDKKEYDCDKYVLPLRSQTGNVLAEIDYYYSYENGKLAYIEKVLVNKGQEYSSVKVKIKEISNVVPADVFNIPQGCKVYAVGIGDMNDLINKPVLVEEY